MGEELKELLNKYSQIFTKPQGLPPIRATDHCIHLPPLQASINVRPYRYPHYQKAEIERHIQKMIGEGIIQHSNSPFFLPVLLVKKKDGTWRFCFDYRALNAVTIKDRFLIPTVDELFDELGAVKLFSKLDLLLGYHQIRVRTGDVAKIAF